MFVPIFMQEHMHRNMLSVHSGFPNVAVLPASPGGDGPWMARAHADARVQLVFLLNFGC